MARRPKTLSPAQVANQVTFLLKGHLKNVQLSYLRVGALLVRVRDERLWKLLREPSIEAYAQAKLGISRATLYRYLQIHDWVSARHPEWLRPKPKGFIPELSDVAILRTIERRLDGRLSAERRKLYEKLREQALGGKLTREDYERAIGHKPVSPLRAFATSLRSVARRAATVDDLPREVVRELTAIAERVDRLTRSSGEIAGLARTVRAELALLGLRERLVARA